MLSNTSNLITVILGCIALGAFAWKVIRKLSAIVQLLRHVVELQDSVNALQLLQAEHGIQLAELGLRTGALERANLQPKGP